MASINWNGGQVVTLRQGDTAVCQGGLNTGQLYALFFYNSANNDADAPVTVVWSNSAPPVSVIVPGTTGGKGLAALCFVSGDDTNTVSASLNAGDPGVQVTAFIGSVKMPTDTSGINNVSMPLDGQFHAFTSFTRFYAVPESHWYSLTLNSNINQFICVQFKESSATVYIVNKLVDPSTVIAYAGRTQSQVLIEAVPYQTLASNLQGNGRQWVWINADSCQNAATAKIAVQSLSASYAAFR